MWWAKLIVLLLLVAAVVALVLGLNSLVRGQGAQGKTARALTWRACLSAAALGFLFLSMWMGWLEPHDVNPNLRDGRPIQETTVN